MRGTADQQVICKLYASYIAYLWNIVGVLEVPIWPFLDIFQRVLESLFGVLTQFLVFGMIPNACNRLEMAWRITSYAEALCFALIDIEQLGQWGHQTFLNHFCGKRQIINQLNLTWFEQSNEFWFVISSPLYFTYIFSFNLIQKYIKHN